MCITKLVVLFLFKLLIQEDVLEATVAVSMSTTERILNIDDERIDKISNLEKKLELQTNRLESLMKENAKMQTNLIRLELHKLKAEIGNSLVNLTNHFECKQEEKDKLVNTEPEIKTQVPRNCREVQKKGGNTSIYYIKPKLEAEAFLVLCDMETRGGGWTYILNRFDGSQNFNLNWTDYKRGFGNPTKEFWLGLEYMNYLTDPEINELLIEMVTWDMKTLYAHYKHFSIGNEASGYSLKVLNGYSGDAGDSFGPHLGYKFSTRDKKSPHDCSNQYQGGWWYLDCFHAYLNGPYRQQGHIPEYKIQEGIRWFHYQYNYSMKQARMMIRPRNRSIPFGLPHKN